MSVKSCNSDPCPEKGYIVRSGYLKKLKTSKKKWFVLRAETAESSARLEYYDTEKKFNSGQAAKRSIPLKTCFNINKRRDTKSKHVIALYTKDDCFCLVLDSEEELDSWLKALLSLQHGEETTDGEVPKPTFEHVWQVTVLERGIGTSLTGCYSLCLTDKTLKLIRKDGNNFIIDLNLANIRSCGYLKQYLFLEIGRSSTLGPGELWMDTEDDNIAQNIKDTIYHAMSTNSNSEFGFKTRNRSSSATESSKLKYIENIPKRQGPPRVHILNQDQIPPSTECQVTTPAVTSCSTTNQIAGGLNWSGNIAHQRTQSLPLAHPTTTTTTTTTTAVTAPAPSDTTSSHPQRVNKRSSKCSSNGRERCDSMPTRPRTTSEGNHPLQMLIGSRTLMPPFSRSHPMQCRDISHSPPAGSPVSPPSVACSTESSGSSYSLVDETDAMCNEFDTITRYGHSLTPDEAIVEEDSSDSPICSNYVQMAQQPSSDDGYVDMSPGGGRHTTVSPTASMSSVASGTPSTDIRFSEYTLEKVSSYFTPSDDEARPARAYSVGSRPETYHSKKHVELAGTPENSRVRAFSVGSKTKRVHGRVLPPHHPHPGAKSNSAPMLFSYRIHNSHGSIGPMDDLMEMDFSSRDSSNNNSSNNSGYMDMTPGQTNNKTPSGYVEMKPGVVSPYVDMSGSSPARSTHSVDNSDALVDMWRANNRSSEYMDMEPKKTYKVEPAKPSTSPIYPWPSNAGNSSNANNDYLDMTANKRVDRNSFSGPLSCSPISNLDAHYNAINNPITPEGYVEMTLGSNKHQRQASLDSSQPKQTNDDYTNMSASMKMRNKKEKSQPITIQTSIPKNSSPICSTRKYSTDFHLPLSSSNSPYSRKNSRRDSKDSPSSSVTTPSSSSSIFPFSLNSPSSPAKPTQPIKVPASVLNTVYKPKDDYTVMDFEKSAVKKADSSDYMNFNPAQTKKIVPAVTSASSESPMDDYAFMKPGMLSPITSKLSNLGFKPISSNKEENTQSNNDDYEMLRESDSRLTGEVKSRPSSTSSELCSSSSTLVGSRPESVNSDRISSLGQIEIANDRLSSGVNDRVSSGASEGQLHYASLDLPPSSDDRSSPRTIKTSPNAAKPSSNEAGVQNSEQQIFLYAEIDFMKSEGVKVTPLPNNNNNNAKVKH